MLNIDDLKIIKKYDKSDMLGVIEAFADQCRAAKAIGMDLNLPDSFRREYKNIVCTGMGGSAIGADIIRSYITDEARIPLSVNRNYTLPNFVGSSSLVIASSYSGNTEETISAYKDASAKGASIIVITSGGQLQEMAGRDGNPVVIIPKGFAPRCALGYSSLTLLILLSKIGIVKDKSRDIDEAIGVLEWLKDEKVGHAVSRKKNPAKYIADSLHLKFPVIYASQGHLDSVVTRWRGELSENAKVLSSGHLFPEMNHNEIVGWENPKSLLEDFVAVMLRDAGDHPRNSRRIDVTEKILEKNKFKVLEVCSFGKGLLARIFSLIYIGDFTSFYLSILNGIDPTPVDRIDYLKKELAKG